ncbi:hypothetical protein [Streptomyces doebereineriae]|uniref:Uncharacterized protein n=1 Tax=Streptomyces doebereineriae TaxID=3075528 RepID=A0ABU2V8V1_9ACTN|nr:hypothetical protein [Streptomyces sp. DSM 41640]MDT0481874.1 hypothetical protein [Streptomyces sp. DSM 41640]
MVLSHADILVVDGTVPGWPSSCTGARAVLVDRPRPDDDDLPRGIELYVDTGYAAAPIWAETLPRIQDSLDSAAALIESIVAVPCPDELADGLLTQLVMARSLLGTVAVELVTVDPDRGYVVTGKGDTASGVFLSLSGTVGPAGLALTTASPKERWRVDMPAHDSARPVSIARFDATGTHTGRPRFESPRRALWRGIHTARPSDKTLLTDLATVARILRERLL